MTSLIELLTSASLFLFVGTFLVTYFLVNIFLLRFKFQDHINHFGHALPLPPRLSSVPVFGSLLHFVGKLETLPDFFMEIGARLGKVFSVKAGSKYMVVLNGREAVQEALVERGCDFADRGKVLACQLSDPHSKGITFSNYDDLRHVKYRILAILKRFGFGSCIMETRILVELESMIMWIRELNGKEFNPRQLAYLAMSSVGASFLFGRRFSYNDSAFIQALEDVHEGILKLSPEVEMFPILRFFPHFRRLIRESVVHLKRLKQFCSDNVDICLQDERNKESFVTSFVEAEGPMFDREQLNCILRDMMLGTADTSSNTLLWLLVVLANRRSLQDRLQSQIDSVVGKDRLPTLDDRPRLPLVEATMLEIMRYRTLAPFAIYHATKCDTRVKGYFIPARTTVIVNLQSVHMDPDSWTRPEEFIPERFLDENGSKIINRTKAIPFSLGKRSCPGEQLARPQIFLFLAGLLQQFAICLPDGVDHIDETVKFREVISPNDFKICLISRK